MLSQDVVAVLPVTTSYGRGVNVAVVPRASSGFFSGWVLGRKTGRPGPWDEWQTRLGPAGSRRLGRVVTALALTTLGRGSPAGCVASVVTAGENVGGLP